MYENHDQTQPCLQMHSNPFVTDALRLSLLCMHCYKLNRRVTRNYATHPHSAPSWCGYWDLKAFEKRVSVGELIPCPRQRDDCYHAGVDGVFAVQHNAEVHLHTQYTLWHHPCALGMQEMHLGFYLGSPSLFCIWTEHSCSARYLPVICPL